MNLDFVSRLVKTQGVRLDSLLTHVVFIVFLQVLAVSKHFVPPLLVNASLGTVLWTAYSESSSALGSCDSLEARPIMIAAISGAVAGGAQAMMAAPAENVRLAIERGTEGGWSHAWKEVLRGTATNQPTGSASLRELRQVRSWMMDVRNMAGRGWNGWGWGVAKDVCGEHAVILLLGRYRLTFQGSRRQSTDYLRTTLAPRRSRLYVSSRRGHSGTSVRGCMSTLGCYSKTSIYRAGSSFHRSKTKTLSY